MLKPITMNKYISYIFFIIIIFTLYSCTQYLDYDNIIEVKSEISYSGNNKTALRLIANIDNENFSKINAFISSDQTILFDQTFFSFNSIDQNHYSVPISNGSNEIKECLIIKEHLIDSLKQLYSYEIKKINEDFLNDINLQDRFIYSCKFLKWQENHLNVDKNLLLPIQIINKSIPTKSDLLRTKSNSGFTTIYISYELDFNEYDLLNPEYGFNMPLTAIQYALSQASNSIYQYLHKPVQIFMPQTGTIEISISENLGYETVRALLVLYFDEVKRYLKRELRPMARLDIFYSFRAFNQTENFTGGNSNLPLPNIPGLNPDIEPDLFTTINLAKTDNFVGYDISGDCLLGCKNMMDNFGYNSYGSPDYVYQLMYETMDHRLQYYGNNPSLNYALAIDCINRHLEANRPIIVGVNNSFTEWHNSDGTDHFILVTGRGYDNTFGYYYTYMDSGRLQDYANDACDIHKNRLYYNPLTHTFQDPFDYNNQPIDVMHVRPNDGQHLDETTHIYSN